MIPYTLSASLVDGPDPDFYTRMADGGGSFSDSTEWAEIYSRLSDMASWGCFQDEPNGTPYEDAQKLVTGGKAIGIVATNNALPALKEGNPDMTWDFAAFPGADAPEDNYMPFATHGAAVVNAGSKQLELALDFVDFLMTPEAMATFIIEAGQLPAVSGLPGYEPSEVSAVALEYQDKDRAAPIVDQMWPNPLVQVAMVSGVQGLAGASDATVSEILAEMDSAYAK